MFRYNLSPFAIWFLLLMSLICIVFVGALFLRERGRDRKFRYWVLWDIRHCKGMLSEASGVWSSRWERRDRRKAQSFVFCQGPGLV